MKTETVYQTYIRTLCSNCKNRQTNLCEIRKDINGTLKCCYYDKDKEVQGYKRQLNITANQHKPIMKNILK